MKRICISMIIMLTGLSFLTAETPKLKRVAMVTIAGGTFTMGSNDDLDYEAIPTHKVTLSSFQMSTTEVTQALYQEVMGKNPSSFKGDTLPVGTVSWYDAVEFCNKLSKLEGLSPAYTIVKNNAVTLNPKANGYRLPTEAQWEFAARGGNKSKNYTYAGSNDADEVAWYGDNSKYKTYKVATKGPNELGLYDMSGNVWEWCYDWYETYHDDAKFTTDPLGDSSGDFRVLRGGGWNDDVSYLRVASRGSITPVNRSTDPGNRDDSLGFRVVLPLSSK